MGWERVDHQIAAAEGVVLLLAQLWAVEAYTPCYYILVCDIESISTQGLKVLRDLIPAGVKSKEKLILHMCIISS